jgi:hypothetical protein
LGIQKQMKFQNKPKILLTSLIFLLWFFALIGIHPDYFSMFLINQGFWFHILLGMIILITGLQYHKRRAIYYLSVIIFLYLYSSIIYFCRILETLQNDLNFSDYVVDRMIFGFIYLILIYFVNSIRTELEKLQSLEKNGLLQKFNILNLKTGSFVPVLHYPGQGSSSPEQSTKKGGRKYSWIWILPASGIVFYLLNVANRHEFSILIFLFLGGFIIFFVGVKTFLAKLIQVILWEREYRVKLYVNIENSREESHEN